MFDNTEIAFKSKTNGELKKAKVIFLLIGRDWVVTLGKRLIQFALFLKIPIGSFVRPVFLHFCGGETVSECKPMVDKLGQFNVGSILDYSVEGSTLKAVLNHTADQIIHTIQVAAVHPNIPFAVFKLTGIARFSFLEKLNAGTPLLSEVDQIEYEELLLRIENICETAHSCEVPVFIDAEDFCVQDAIDELVWKMALKYNKEKVIVFNTIQAYRKDRFEYLVNVHKKAKAENIKCGIKLVRGAYMEKERSRAASLGYPSPIHDNKHESDQCFNNCLTYILEHLNDFSICLGTHNEESTNLLMSLMNKNNISKNDSRIVFSQLLGMSDNITFNLAHKGFSVAKYVPFGPIKEVIPYLIRRAEENTSVAGQTGRELQLIQNELKRRTL